MSFLLVITSPIINIIWVLLIIAEFISHIINNATLSKKWQTLLEKIFKMHYNGWGYVLYA